jgi:predicted RNA-binding protein with PIN domain
VEAALAAARDGLRADPVVIPPPALRPYLEFARLSPTSLAAIARVVDDDDEFRARVASTVGPEDVGRGGWLWLARPDGWQDELAALDAEDVARAVEARDARAERSASRKLGAAQAAAARAEADAEASRSEVARVRRELSEERAHRADLEVRLAELESAVASLTEARATAVRSLKDAEARLVDRSTEVNAVKARLRALEAEARARAAENVPDEAEPATGDEPRPAPEPDAEAADRRPDPDLLAREIERAARGAASLADGLSSLASLFGSPSPTTITPQPRGDVPSVAGRGGTAPDPSARTTRRMPVPLPGGVLDDSVDAAIHLLRTPGVVLVVDGYNVTMTGWPELGAGAQRRRLVAALADLAARTSTRVELVFDGADVGDGPVTVPAPARQLVRVRFSPPGVEADDVVLDLVAQLPAAWPVVVASSDNRVRDGARRTGANLLYSRQLLDTLGIGAS